MDSTKGKPLKFMQFFALCCVIFTSSCATPERPDPLEKFNRVMFKVDRVIDTVVIGPVARAYDHLPSPVHTHVGNFFSNTFEPAVVVNDMLQGDINDAFMDFGRFLVNSTAGIAGLFDVAKHMGLVKHYNDFGITLAKWGYRNSAYLYIPCLGPMTIRDTASLAIDYWIFNPISYIPTDKIRLSILGVGKVHWRWALLPADKVIRESFDPYIFMRNAFLQKRQAIINEVVVGHHTAEDTYVHEFDDAIIEDDPVDIEHISNDSKSKRHIGKIRISKTKQNENESPKTPKKQAENKTEKTHHKQDAA